MVKVWFYSILFISSVFAQQPLTCSARQYPPATVRVEGYTELLGDMVVACTGGTPTAANVPIPFVDVTLSLPVPVTNRKNANETFIDALLFVDEPHSVKNPNVPLTPCLSCAPVGNGSGQGVYNGSAAYPNVFQGELTGNSTVRFRVPFDPPGTGVERIVRIANVRVNGTRMVGVVPNTVVGSLNIPGAAMSPGTQILGLAHRALRIATVADNVSGFPTNAPVALFACPGLGIAPLRDPDVPNLILNIEETARDGLRSRNVAQDQSSGPMGAFGSLFTADKNQNVIGYPYGTESGVFAGSSSNPAKPVPQIGVTAPFGNTRGLDRTGLATHGTRFYVRFANSGGLSISMPVSIVFAAEISSGIGYPRGSQAAPTRAILVQGDSLSSSASFVPVAGNAKGFARIPNNGSTTTAIYEVVSGDPSTLEWASIPVFVDQQGTAIDRGKVLISVGLGPQSDIAGPDSLAPIPRFANDLADTIEGFYYNAINCGSVQDVSIAWTSASGTRGGTGIVNLVYGNDSSVAVPETVTVDVALPSSFTATSIGAPAGFTCTLQPLRCTTSGDRRGRFAIAIVFEVSPSAPAIALLSASVTASGDEVPSNNTATVPLRTTAFVDFEVQNSPWANPDVILSVGGIHSVSRVRAFVNPGDVVNVSTIANQYMADGSLRTFKSWTNGGALSQTFTVPPYDSNRQIRGLTANFEGIQPLSSQVQCVVDVGVPPLVPATDRTAALGDMTLNCTGGVPTPGGAPVPKVDIRVSVGSFLTSRSVFPGVSEALLIVDEPHSAINPNVPLLPCGASGSGSDANGVCFNTGSQSATYGGMAGRPNVFQGVFDGGDSVLFQQVPFDPPGPGFTRIFRITNLRADASLLPVSYSLLPTYMNTNVRISSFSGALPIQGNASVVAFIQAPLRRLSGSPSAFLSQCQGANPQIALDSSQPLDTGAGNGAQAEVGIAEAFPSAFVTKNRAVWNANRPNVTSASYPADSKQNVPGAIFNTQTMFYAGPGTEPNVQLLGIPTLPSAADFPAFRGLNIAGKADSGTRVTLRLSGVPMGVKVFVPVRIFLISTLSSFVTGIAHLTATDEAGAGTFSRITGNASGLAPLTVTPSGEATAFYEILSSDPFTQERTAVPVAFAFTAGQPGLGTIQITAGLGPISATGAIPRFAPQFLDQRQIAVIQTCAVPDLQLTMTRSGPRTGNAGTTYRLNVTNVGAVVAPAPERLAIQYGSPIVSLTGTGWTCSATNRLCTRSEPLAPGASYPSVTLELGPAEPTVSFSLVSARLFTSEQNQSNDSVTDSSPILNGGQTFTSLPTPCRLVDTRNTANGTVARLQPKTFSLAGKCGLPSVESPFAATAYALNVTVVPKNTLGYITIWPAGQDQPLVSTLNSLDGRVKANAAIIPAGANSAVSVFATDDTEVILDLTGYFANTGGLDFFPVDPCRMVDTRNPTGPYGGPSLVPLASRSFRLSISNCVTGLPTVFSLNATVVPTAGPFGYLTLFNPTSARPTVSTLNAVTGAITANALLIGGSTNDGLGQIAAFGTEPAHLLLDLNGVFRDGSVSPGLKYYPIQPCRLVDTRNPAGPYGGPALAKTTERVFDFPAGGCGIPANSRAYAVNATVVPSGPFGFLTMWGTGMPRPTVSTLNALDGAITSNAAIVTDSAGAQRGRISVYGSDAVHLILDVNGYFAP